MADQPQPGRGRPSTRALVSLALVLLALLLCGIVGGWLRRCRGPLPTLTPTATRSWPVVETPTQTATATPTPTAGEPLTPGAGTPAPSPAASKTPATAAPATATPSATATATVTTAAPPPTAEPEPTATATHTPTPPTAGLYIELEGAPLQAANAAPGVSIPPQELTLRNRAISTAAAKYRLRSVFTAGSSAFFDGLNVRACRRASDGTWPCYYEGTLRDMLLTPDPGHPGTTPGMVVSPSEEQRWRLTYTPDAGLGNWAQGATCSFSIVADATEAGNPGWLP